MKRTVDLLSAKERSSLALWYDSESYRSLKHLLSEERANIATKLLDVPPDDATTIARHQGRADCLKQLHLTLKENYEKQVKTEDPKKKQMP